MHGFFLSFLSTQKDSRISVHPFSFMNLNDPIPKENPNLFVRERVRELGSLVK